MMRVLYQVFLFILTLLSVEARAAGPCDAEFRSEASNALYEPYSPGRKLDSDQMRSMVRKFIDLNPVVLEIRDLRPDQIRITKIEKLGEHPHFPTIKVWFESDGYDLGINSYFTARTNGKTVFIDESYDYSQGEDSEQKFWAVYEKKSGEIAAIDQTDAILETLPGQVTLSRVMGETEYKIWTEGGDPSRLFSHGAGGGTRSRITPRTTFALNYFEFGGEKPVIVQIPKSVLIELRAQGRLVINTYNDILDPYQGLSKEALTSFGLETEIVVLENEGRAKIQPYMKDPTEVPDELPIRLVQKYFLEAPRSYSKAKKKAWYEKEIRRLYELEKAKGLHDIR